MKILITSDNHLGYKEKDPVRSEDSFSTFEEILQIASLQHVDLILQGGDLFDENKPSRSTYNKTIQLLRKYCSGRRRDDLKTSIPLNIGDEKLAIEVPLLCIHGNHDDPSGFDVISPLDVLHSAGLLNYFGRQMSTDRIVIEPILLEMASYRLAIYGLGYIKGRLLHRAFETGRVSYARPEGDDWYSILVVHQDRVPRAGEYLPEDFIDPFFDLVVYGHEHESIKFRHRNFDVIQCGSTVRTSLCEYETHDKYVYLLDLAAATPISRIRLQTVRPFLMETIKINSEEPEAFIRTKLEEMAAKAKFNHGLANNDGREKLDLIGNEAGSLGSGNIGFEKSIFARSMAVFGLPLLRLRVEVRSDAILNKHRIQQYLGGISANPMDVLRVIRRPAKRTTKSERADKTIDICNIYEGILQDLELSVLPCSRVLDALSDYIHKDAKESFSALLGESVNVIVDCVDYENVVLEDVAKMIRRAKDEIYKRDQKRVSLEEEPFEIVFDEKDVEALCSGNSDSFQPPARICSRGTLSMASELSSNVPNCTLSSTRQDFTFLEDKRAALESKAVVEQLEKDPTVKKNKNDDSDNDLFAFINYAEK